jgi:hypothetical protein
VKVLASTSWGDPVVIIPLEDVPPGVQRSQGAGYGPDQEHQTPEEAAAHIVKTPHSFPINYARGPQSTVVSYGRRNDRAYVVAVWATDVASLISAPLNYGTAPPVTKRVMKQWPHDCPKCKGRECAIELATTWDCRNGCWK